MSPWPVVVAPETLDTATEMSGVVVNRPACRRLGGRRVRGLWSHDVVLLVHRGDGRSVVDRRFVGQRPTVGVVRHGQPGRERAQSGGDGGRDLGMLCLADGGEDRRGPAAVRRS